MRKNLDPLWSVMQARADGLEMIAAERRRQDRLWGRDSIFQPRDRRGIILAEEVGELAQAMLDGNSEDIITEAVQTAAVALSIIEAELHGGRKE